MTVLSSVFCTDTERNSIPENAGELFRKIQKPYEVSRFKQSNSSISFWVIQREKPIGVVARVDVVFDSSKQTCCMTSTTTKKLENPMEVMMFLYDTLKKVFPTPKKKALPK